MLRSTGFMFAALLSAVASQAAAQEWAQKMFNVLDHDFGTVARGADTVFRFEVTNLYKQDMTLTGVRSSCGCTSPTIEGGPTIKTHEKAYIAARFNTRTFVGQKGATLTVTLGAPYFAEVQLHVHGNIRSDVVFNPGAIDFGDVNEGEPAERRVAVEYAGRTDWEIVDVMNENDNFAVELVEKARSPGRVSYELGVTLKAGLPAGRVKDQLTVVTNDSRPENQRIPLFVSGHVRPEFSVTPELLVLGEIEPGKATTKRIVVRGREPFKITNVSCGEDCLEFKHDDQARAVHFVEVTFRAGEEPGKLQTPIRIVTDRGEGRAATCVASATVIAAKPVIDAAPAAETTGSMDTVGGVRTASAP
ncbi:MAG TPA: DUF1573 domain-containing protein [Lacipirellulaceae bacterium]|nr:DUF1573 domain-containing protein [Lacipirellulaceae bacterium]